MFYGKLVRWNDFWYYKLIIWKNQIRSKRRDNFRHPSFSSSQNKIIDQEEKQARTDMDLNSNRKKNGNLNELIKNPYF